MPELQKLTDQQLSGFYQQKTALLIGEMDKAGTDALAGRITPEQSDIDIGRLLDELKAIQNEVEIEQARRKQKKQIIHRTMLISISLLAAAFFYLVFFY
jgi:hypothetical protein